MAFVPKSLLLLIALGASACAAIAQDPMATYPKNYMLALDNNVTQVIRVHYGPHERIGVHDHSKFPTVYVYLSASGPVRFEHDEKPSFRLTRAPTSVGAFRVSPGRIERHAVDNVGDLASDFLRVELKQVPLGSSLQPFRGKAPTGPLQSSRAVEFESPQLDIQRVICEEGPSCKLDISASPSLFIAFSPLKEIENNDTERGALMSAGDVKWVRGSQAVSIVAATRAPAHLLRIRFKLQQN
jgi:hypothetical protein